jgi:uncharacterized surface protein with fasciclin (FAS1) repeats
MQRKIFAIGMTITAMGVAGIGPVAAQTAAPVSPPTGGTPAASPPAASAAAPLPMVGGAPMFPTKTIVENASASRDHTTLVAAIKASGLVETLSGPGPFTVFAPTNDAFSRLAPGTVTTLMKPANKASLVKVLTYHVLAGKLSVADLRAKIKASNGSATLTTLQGQPLTATLVQDTGIKLADASGNVAYVTQADIAQSNGVVHVINGVLIPKLD